MLPSVSVIIAAYNAANYIERACASALSQKDVTVEVLVVNDCSTDRTAERVLALSARDARIKLLATPVNSGPAAARNIGLAAATGAWCAILDADDAFAPDRLARLIGEAGAQGFDVIGDLPVYYDLSSNAEEPAQPHASGEVSELGVMDFLIPDAQSGVDMGLLQPVFPRKLVEDGLWVYPTNLRHGEDFSVMLTVLRAGLKVGLLRERMYIYSTRLGAISGQFSPGSVTAVNYHAVADHSAALLENMQGAGDLTPEIRALLEKRITNARRQNRAYCWNLLRRLSLGRLRKWLARDPRNRADLIAVLRQKASGHRGLPK